MANDCRLLPREKEDETMVGLFYGPFGVSKDCSQRNGRGQIGKDCVDCKKENKLKFYFCFGSIWSQLVGMMYC